VKDRDARLLDAAVAGAGVSLGLIFSLPRLPQSADFIVARRSGFWLFELAMSHRGAVGQLALGVLGLSVVVAGREFWPRARALKAAPKGRLAACAAGLAAVLLVARWAVSSTLDVVQNALFMPESLDLREPVFTLCFMLLVVQTLRLAVETLFSRALRERGGARSKLSTAIVLALVAVSAAVYGVGALGRDAAKSSLEDAAGFSPAARTSRVFVVLVEKDGRADYEVHRLELGGSGQSRISDESAEKAYDYVLSHRGAPTVYTLAALRYLYGAETMQMDPARLRAALSEGVAAGDPAARALLLEHLAAATPADEAAAELDALSDAASVRVGPMGAARLALACAHQGLRDKAADWRARSGIPEGLLARDEEGGALKPGVIGGRVRGARRELRIGLYAHPDPLAPYAMGPGKLVDAATAGKNGRFEFKGLAAGDYFLAFALDFDEGGAPKTIRVRGHRGDIKLSRSRPKIELPELQLSY
jgi:hypothetical protein